MNFGYGDTSGDVPAPSEVSPKAKNDLFHQAALLACDAAADKKGEDVVLIDLQGQTAAADYFVLVTVHSQPHAKAVAQAVEKALDELPLARRGLEGYPKTSWILLDYYGLVVHVFLKEERDYYNLEKLWTKERS